MDEAPAVLVVVLILFVPVLLIGAGLELLAALQPRWAGIKLYVSDWDELERGSAGDASQLADPRLPRFVHDHESADSTSVTSPQHPVSDGVRRWPRARHLASDPDLRGNGHEAVSLEMFGRLFDGGAGNETRSEPMALAAAPGSILVDTRRHAPDGLASG